MVQYRRNRIEGGTYFFTVALRDRRAALLVERIEELRMAVRGVMTERRFHIDAWVVLPDHLHAIWTLPENDDDYAVRWRSIKSRDRKDRRGGDPQRQGRIQRVATAVLGTHHPR